MASMPPISSSRYHGAAEGRSRQKGPLDVALLCNKLEAWQIQQNAAQTRRRYRRAVSKEKGIPTFGAAHLAMGSTASTQRTEAQRYHKRSNNRPHISEAEARSQLRTSQIPLDIDFDRDLDLSFLDNSGLEESQEKCDSAQTSPGPQCGQDVSREQDAGQSKLDSVQKRRTMIACLSPEEEARIHANFERTFAWTRDSLAPKRSSGDGIYQRTSNAGKREHDNHLEDRPLRRPEYARHNWTQASQNDDSLTGHWPFNLQTGTKDRSRHAEESGRQGAGSKREKVAGRKSKKKEGHLISEAVERMKEKERAHRKTTLLRMFKKS